MALATKLSRVDAPTLFSGSESAAADDTLIMTSLPFSHADSRAAKVAEDTVILAPELLASSGNTLPFPPPLSARPSPWPPLPVPSSSNVPANDAFVDPSNVELVASEPELAAAVVTQPIGQQVGSAFVKAYRVAGFVILAAILGGLGTYVGTHLFFLFNRGWVVPTILTPTDPRVLGFASRFVEESARRDALLVQRADVEMRRKDAERHLAIEKAFQSAYSAAMREDLADRKADLSRAKSMLGSYATARRSISTASEAFRTSSEQTLRQEFDAGVIDKSRLLGENLQLAQIADTRLSLDARNVELQGRVAALGRMVDSLDSAMTAGGTATSYEVLKIRAEFDRSVGAAAKASDELEATTKSVAMIDETLRAEERIVATMTRSAYHGIASRTVFAFVPYDNATAAKEGAPVYACRLGVVWCRKVGRLGKAADGELVEKHPLLHQDLRGYFVRIEIDEPEAAENAVLHISRKPLFF